LLVNKKQNGHCDFHVSAPICLLSAFVRVLCVSLANYLQRILYNMAQMCYAEETSKNAFPTRVTKLVDKNRICRNTSLFQIFLLRVILLVWRWQLVFL